MLERFYSLDINYLHPWVATTRIFWPYLLSAIVLTLIVYLLKKPQATGFSLKGFFGFAFPRSVYAHKSAIQDYLYFFINQVVHGFIVVPFIITAPFISGLIYVFLRNHFGEPSLQFVPSFSVNLMISIMAAILADFAQFIAHYCNHRIPFLWNFHKVHHSAEVLTPITVYRAHPVELLINANLIALSTGLVFGISNYFAATPIAMITILKINVVVFLFNLLGSNLRHSHIWIQYPSFLSRLFISPAQHQIHHSVNPAHFNKNYGSVFAVWDGLFKSLYIPKKREQFEIGLNNQEHKKFSNLWRLYGLPFLDNAGLLRKSFFRKSRGLHGSTELDRGAS